MRGLLDFATDACVFVGACIFVGLGVGIIKAALKDLLRG
jgi:hypothetical protein